MTRPKPTLALAMIVKDEEANIEQCLDSVIGIVDQVVIVDTGSRDRTADIIWTYAEKFDRFDVEYFKWIDDFAAARNFGMEHVKTDWVLHLDADEELISGADQLPYLLGDRYRTGYFCQVIGGLTVDSPTTEVFPAIRLFRSEHRFEMPIHEQVVIPERDRKTHCDIQILHRGVSDDGHKRARNIKILERTLSEEFDPFLAFCLGQEYLLLDKHLEASVQFARALKHVETLKGAYPAAAIRNLGLCYHMIGNTQEALDLLKKGYDLHPSYTDIPFITGSIHSHLGNHDKAARFFDECRLLGEPPKQYMTWGGCASWRIGELKFPDMPTVQ